MKLRIQIVLVNAVILAGLVFEYFRGAALHHVLLTGILLLAMINLMFFIRSQEKKSGL